MPSHDITALVRFFQSVYPSTDAMATEMAQHFSPVQVKRGELFLEAGARSNVYFFLEQGFMRSYLYDTEGTEVTTNLYSSGNVVLEVASFFLRTPSQENFQAVTDCTGWTLTFDELNGLFHALPAFRETGRAILVRALVAMKLRTLSMINQTAEQRYTTMLTSNPEIFRHVPLKYIASYLGITDTSLSRIRKEFAVK
jgi:CRP-like cAMP-binding protein